MARLLPAAVIFFRCTAPGQATAAPVAGPDWAKDFPPVVQSTIAQGICAKDYPQSEISQGTPDRAEQWVEVHNHYRACHGAAPVSWDPNLANLAARWASTLVMHCEGMMDVGNFVRTSGLEPHDPCAYTTEVPHEGENLAMYETGMMQFMPIDEAFSVEGWYREVETECTNKGLTPGCEGKIMNHFTALIWKTVTRIGCYTAVRGSFKVVACRYANAEPDGGTDCEVPNMVSGEQGQCGPLMVPALVGGQCPALGAAGQAANSPLAINGPGGMRVVPIGVLLWNWVMGMFHGGEQGGENAGSPSGSAAGAQGEQHMELHSPLMDMGKQFTGAVSHMVQGLQGSQSEGAYTENVQTGQPAGAYTQGLQGSQPVGAYTARRVAGVDDLRQAPLATFLDAVSFLAVIGLFAIARRAIQARNDASLSDSSARIVLADEAHEIEAMTALE